MSARRTKPNTLMYFADGKKAMLDLVAAVKAG
jgi:hypothetical protein